MSKKGSGEAFFLTSGATTVVGTVAGYQPLGLNLGVERTSPPSVTLVEDCRDQPAASGRRVSGAPRAAQAAGANPSPARKTINRSIGIGAAIYPARRRRRKPIA